MALMDLYVQFWTSLHTYTHIHIITLGLNIDYKTNWLGFTLPVFATELVSMELSSYKVSNLPSCKDERVLETY